MLSADQSAITRDRLLADLDGITGADQLADWAKQTIPVKNDLGESDAAIIEAAFTAKTADLPSEVSSSCVPILQSPSTDRVFEEPPSPQQSPAGTATRRIDKSVLAFPEPRRIRDKEHLKFVAAQPCLVCGRSPSDAHHIRFAQLRALGRKVSDEFTVPLCRGHHRQLHQSGNEIAFWSRLNLEPLKVASELWKQTRSPDVTPDNLTGAMP